MVEILMIHVGIRFEQSEFSVKASQKWCVTIKPIQDCYNFAMA